jgi:hypothetical protein
MHLHDFIMKKIPFILFGLLVVFARCAMAATMPLQADFFVAVGGNDHWSGRLATPSADRSDGPFATLERARDAVRSIKNVVPARTQPVLVLVRGGIYFLVRPLLFEPADSGTAQAPVIYAAYPGEEPVISGGTAITGWHQVAGNRWEVTLPEVASGRWSFEQLYVNDQRRLRPQLPKHGYYYIGGEMPLTAEGKPDRFVYHSGQISAAWHNLTDVEVVVLHWWMGDRIRIQHVDPAARVVTLAGPTQNRTRSTLAPFSWFRLENVREALSEPGEWYLDRTSGVLTYLALPGEDVPRAQIIAPRHAQIMRLRGDPLDGKFVEHLIFRGLTLAHSAWNTPRTGYTYPQADVGVDAAIEMSGARDCTLEECVVRQTGNYAVNVGEGAARVSVVGCELFDLGAGGIKVGSNQFFREANERLWSTDCTLSDNLIAHGGRIFPAAVGIWTGHANKIRIEHNDIDDFYYSGVSVGWSFHVRPSVSHHNTIAYNHITRIGQGVLSDLGGVYTLGEQPGTTVESNVISDVSHARYGGHGIYLDAGSAEILVQNNLVYRTADVGINQNFGRDNTVRNNVFAFGHAGQVRVGNQERSAGVLLYQRNIFYWRDSTFFFPSRRALTDKVKFDGNLYWEEGKPAPMWSIKGSEQPEWPARNVGGIAMDPLFIAPSQGDFRLRPGSPAEKIGFTSLTVASAGRLTKTNRTAALPAVPETFSPAPEEPMLEGTTWHEDFEALALKEFPPGLVQSEVGNVAMGTTDEFAASGHHSFLIQNAPVDPSLAGQTRLGLRPRFADGQAELAFDLRLEPGAQPRVEWANAPYSHLATSRGPAFAVGPDGALIVNGRSLLQLPARKWVRLKMTCLLGPAAHGQFSLEVTVAGQPPARFENLACDGDFRNLQLVGFVNLSKGLERCFIDNIELTCRQP